MEWTSGIISVVDYGLENETAAFRKLLPRVRRESDHEVWWERSYQPDAEGD